MTTYTWGELLTLVSNQIPKSTESDKAAFILNVALDKVWRRYDWPESTAPLPPFALQPGEQDYGPPTIAVPPDFDGLRIANFVQLTGYPAVRDPLQIRRNLTRTNLTGLPKEISYEPSIYSFRIFPRPPENYGAPYYQIDGKYKKRATKLVAADLHSTLMPFDDKYLGMWVDVAKWAAWDIAGNPQAGEVTYSSRGKQFTGQLAKAMSAIDEMASDAGLLLGDDVVTPVEPWLGTHL